MHIPLPNGDKLVPDAEWLKAAGDVTPRTGSNWDKWAAPTPTSAERSIALGTRGSPGSPRASSAVIPHELAPPKLPPKQSGPTFRSTR